MLGRTRLHPTSLPSDVCHKWKLLSPSFPGKRKDWFNEACKTPTPSSSVRPSFLLSEPPKLCFSHYSRPPAPNPSRSRVIRERGWVKGLQQPAPLPPPRRLGFSTGQLPPQPNQGYSADWQRSRPNREQDELKPPFKGLVAAKLPL